MTPFKTLTSTAAPLLRDNVDTDAIIPSREMTSVSKNGLADGLFANWRYLGIGSREPDPSFVLNLPLYADARILLSGSNFACGSSREHAAWALAEYGFRAVLAVSFNPIFRGNCVNNGIVPVALTRDVIERLARPPADQAVTVDLEHRRVCAGNQSWPFVIDGEAREMLLTGMDAIDRTLTHRDLIAAARAADRRRRPWIYLADDDHDQPPKRAGAMPKRG